MPASADRQLLFGWLALQNGLVDQAMLAAGIRAWTLDRSKDLADHLTDLGGLDADGRAVVDDLVRLHVETRGNAPKTPDGLAIDATARERLAALADAELDATLPLAPPAPTGADDRRGPSVDGGGRFRILRPHANGSLGTVFVALDTELKREVALKRIREKYADEPASRARFLLEAEVTGRLEHPGIVPVHGLGTLDDGRPYYAMRLVRGDSLKEVVAAFHAGEGTRAERALRFRRLLRNFTDVCHAVDYAHSRGVLHRDLKPANVIVGDHGETFVVDWGLAKPLDHAAPGSEEGTLAPGLIDGSSETLPGQAMGTPGYMSPEQARGDLETLGPRSDVYSLGATLYHVLTGRPPFQGTAPSVLNQVVAGDFPRPREVDATIDPALEAIVLRAMAAKPAQRYASPRTLADDVDRWLADERVGAHAEPRYRTLIRWLTRHRTSVTGLAAAGLAAFAGLVAVSTVQTRANVRLAASNEALRIQRKRAEANEAQAIDAVKRFKDAVADNPDLKDDPRLESLRKALLKEPLAFFGRLRERLEAEADARPEALDRLADVALDHARLIAEIGDKQDAIRAVRQALDLHGRLVRDHPGVADYRNGLAAGSYTLGVLLNDVGRLDESDATFERARDCFEQLAREHPDDARYRGGLADVHGSLGLNFRAEGRTEEALTAFRSGVESLERLIADHPDVARYQSNLAVVHGNLAITLVDAGRLDEARTSYGRTVEIFGRLARDHPDVAQYQAMLANGRGNLAEVLRTMGRFDEARTGFERARELLERLVGEHPAVAAYQDYLGEFRYDLANLSRAEGRPDEARAEFERSLEIYRRLVRERPEVPGYASRVGWALNGAALADLDASRFANARDRLREAVDWVRKARAVDPVNAYYRRNLDDILVNLIRAERGLGHDGEAARIERELAEVRNPAPKP